MNVFVVVDVAVVVDEDVFEHLAVVAEVEVEPGGDGGDSDGGAVVEHWDHPLVNVHF